MKTVASQSRSIREALTTLGLRAAGGNYAAFKRACRDFGIPCPQFEYPTGFANQAFVPDEQFFVLGRERAGNYLKTRLLASGVPEQCVVCGLGPWWNRQPLSLQVDHVNGDHADNRRENLRIVCPNCHTQTELFAGKAHNNKATCPLCGDSMHLLATTCRSCKQKPRPTKIEWPPHEDLQRMVDETSYVVVGRELGVSNNAVSKRLKTH